MAATTCFEPNITAKRIYRGATASSLSWGAIAKLYLKTQTTKIRKGGHHVAAEACLYDLVTTGHDHPRVDAEGRATRLRTPGHKAGSVGQPGE